jgi:hypothetical protein
MIKLSTEVSLPEVPVKLSYRRKSMMLGSCFAESIGTKLQELCYPIDVNPFGILYNPVSIANSLEILLEGKLLGEDELFYANGLWNSFYHHSRFSNTDKRESLVTINNRIEEAAKTLKECNLLFVTFGTSWVFEDRSSGQVVSNCHKLPASTFRHYRLTSAQIVERWIKLVEKIYKINQDIHLIFTVSPIRHLKDGEHENQLSKSILLIAVDELIKYFKGVRINYFPSYEIVLDELRDYRYYASDMVHMNEVAVGIIQEKVASVFIDQGDKIIVNEIEKLRQALEHRPLNAGSDEYQHFIEKQYGKAIQLKDKFNYLDLQLILDQFCLKKAP